MIGALGEEMLENPEMDSGWSFPNQSRVKQQKTIYFLSTYPERTNAKTKHRQKGKNNENEIRIILIPRRPLDDMYHPSG